MADPPDLADLVVHDHRVIHRLLAALRSDRQDRFVLAHHLLDEVAAHAAVVTQVLWPALRDIVPGGVEMADRAQEADPELRRALRAIEDGGPGDPAFEAAIEAVGRAMSTHVPVEEDEQLPALRAVIGSDAMWQLGMVYSQVRDNIPSGLDGLPPSGSRQPRFRRALGWPEDGEPGAPWGADEEDGL